MSGLGDLNLVMPANERIKKLTLYASDVNIDPKTPITRYFRSSSEIYRTAFVYIDEGNFESAYILLVRYLTLFIEQIQKHPEYKTTDSRLKKSIVQKIKEIMPKTEEIKQTLLQKYSSEYETFLKDREIERQRAADEVKLRLAAAKNKSKNATIQNPTKQFDFSPSAPSLESIDVTYPDDFLSSERVKANSPGLITPSVDRSSKPKGNFIDPINSCLNIHEGKDKRKMFVPSDLIQKFLEAVKSNTEKKHEACGYIFGIPSKKGLIVTHVFIPKQTVGTDNCETTSDGAFEVARFCFDNHYCQYGWIHTHPTQDCFFSSIDLHNQYDSQKQLAEYFGIVCSKPLAADAHQRINKAFVLNQRGLDACNNCKEAGFHAGHNGREEYEEADHIIWDSNQKIEILDHRYTDYVSKS